MSSAEMPIRVLCNIYCHELMKIMNVFEKNIKFKISLISIPQLESSIDIYLRFSKVLAAGGESLRRYLALFYTSGTTVQSAGLWSIFQFSYLWNSFAYLCFYSFSALPKNSTTENPISRSRHARDCISWTSCH